MRKTGLASLSFMHFACRFFYNILDAKHLLNRHFPTYVHKSALSSKSSDILFINCINKVLCRYLKVRQEQPRDKAGGQH